MSFPSSLTQSRHPYYTNNLLEWQLWRDTYMGGWVFINRHLHRFTGREDQNDFEIRRKLTPSPSFARSAVDDVVNSVYQRMGDITRIGGPESYMNCLNGLNQGVDLLGSSMNYFIGKQILPELLTMKRVGIFVDMPPTEEATLLEVREKNLRPYLYMYQAEEICNWMFDYSSQPNEFTNLLLQETYNVLNEDYGLPEKTATRFRYLYINQNGKVQVEFYSDRGDQIDIYGNETDEGYELDINRIPFIMFEIPHSLLEDAARYQVALLNMASSDIMYCLKANFPFYIEQVDHRANPQFTRPVGSDEKGTDQSGAKQVETGISSGRQYPATMNAPAFIHPSPEPLRVSMDKQEQMKAEIRQLINLAVTQLNPNKQASAESKGMDNQGLEAGLSCIGLELERGERRIAEYWGMYLNQKPATVFYPQRYSLKSDSERLEEAEKYCQIVPAFPSRTYQKEVAKIAINTLIGTKVPQDVLTKIHNEIDAAPITAVDPETINQDVIAGILDKENAAKARLYPADAVDKANKEHAERLAVIAAQQTAGQARGNADGSADPLDGKKERQAATDGSNDPVPQDKSRGDGK